MSAQKNKAVLAATLAIIGVFLLGGISWAFFPAQTQPTMPSIETYQTPIILSITGPSSNQTNVPIYAVGSCGVCYPQPNSIIIKNDGSVNSTAIRRNGDTYTLTEDIINSTIFIERSDIVLNGANHALIGFSNALENINLENVHDVIIENFNISLSWASISLEDCTDITIQNNQFTDVNTGVALSSNNCKVTGNDFFAVTTAISCPSSQNTIISKNTIYAVATGIAMLNANRSTVTDNVIVGAYDPIYAGENAIISGNILIGGIDAVGVTTKDQVFNNVICNFSESGISLSGTNSAIYQNTITNCSSAIFMSGSNDVHPLGINTIWHNNFVNNTQPVALYTNASLSINYWDNGKEGNYWSSYNGSDVNGDGIGDTPYVLAANCTDNYPLIQPYTAASSNVKLGTLFFAAAAVTALVGTAVIVCVYAKFRGRS